MSPITLTIEGFVLWISHFPILINSILVITFIVGGFVIAASIQRLLSQRTPTRETAVELDLTQLPFPSWTLSEQGQVLSANCDAPPPVPNAPRFMTSENGVEQYYTTITSVVDDQTRVFAFPCDELVSLEKTNKRLMETMSTTFAKLPVGLAIFDADNTLTHFNPAVTSLLDLDPAWLARRPTIAAILEKLRENRHLPDHKDFLDWRRLLVNMQGTSQSKSYSEVWTLPNGSSLQVSGEAHTNGATTFLFDDITAHVAIERRQFAETALNQAVIDRILDPMVVINPAGSLISSNKAFDELFRCQTADNISDTTISSLATDFPVATEFWSKLQKFISLSFNRVSWSLQINLDTIRTADVHPMPDGSTLVFLRMQWVSPRAAVQTELTEISVNSA